MKFIADFHIHSRYSRATSSGMELESLDKWAKIKGIKVLSTGDFTHPVWFSQLKEKLVLAEPGLFILKDNLSLPGKETRFILTTEISCIYSKSQKTRKVHILIFSPSLETAEKINAQLGWIGNLKSDGRPILGLDAKELAKIVLNIDQNCVVVPAHIWTPWFAIFGSKSGFDSIEECFEEYSKYIFAIETGLSSDPKMNWQISKLDNISLISNSDAHSPQKLGREANVFDAEMSYPAIVQAIKSKDPLKFLYTIEFFPEEGKYHYDGHNLCKVSLSPEESKKLNNICPVCKRPLTIGVLNRVQELADRREGEKPSRFIPFKSIIPLEEVIADALGSAPASKKVSAEYNNMIGKIGSEFHILLDAPFEILKAHSDPRVAEGIIKVREGKAEVEPGYDGVYGKIKIFGAKEKAEQKSLF